ncbi:hypothetical protein [Legionella parisiensis]|uniref:Uncharacterized protein n=1 Tax=Legionella parisiensis TaxID=45071 RepID=A0A1E5JWW2_9GAMM|nr:hypothetical protein [Legionella parisiensis]KTD41789.1 hypothetical protein Lpar_3106 [Legionella parisiensis]OEH48863.1 hypothetical protein lpari_00110 [Legionella parisiensis]STX75886.1 Uncharacterised protein [Legionella parisiensis]
MKKMECSKTNCLWALRFEVLGVILLGIATCLTIFTGDSLGIAALFAAGVILCLFNKFCSQVCSSKQPSCPVCDSSHSEESIQKQEKKEGEVGQTIYSESTSQTKRGK